MEKKTVKRSPGGIIVKGRETVEAMECCRIDHGQQGTTTVYVINHPPGSEAEAQERRKRVNDALHRMWLSVQEKRMKQAEAAG